MEENLTICSKCVLDSRIPNIKFNEKGICNYCDLYDKLDSKYAKSEKQDELLQQKIQEIKIAGKNKEYDCIIGISGGIDSSYALYLANKLGLRILAVHFDNGWNSELAVNNIKRMLDILDIDLYTYVVDWEEFKQLQIAFLKASVPDVELLTDHAIVATLYKVAKKFKTNYIISGGNFRTEGFIPRGWTYMDDRYFNSIIKRFSKIKKLKSYPRYTSIQRIRKKRRKKTEIFRILDYIDYNKELVLKLLVNNLEFREYEGKHYESLFTKWFQSYLLYNKFGIDKRKVHYSALICSDQMKREEGLKALKSLPYNKQEILREHEYIKKKLELTDEDFNQIILAPPLSFEDYPNNYKWIKLFRFISKNFNKKIINRP